MGALALLRKLANLHQKARTSIRKNDSIQFRAYITREHSFHSLRNFTVSAIVPLFFFDRRFQFQLELNEPKDVVQRFALHGKISCPFPSPSPPPLPPPIRHQNGVLMSSFESSLRWRQQSPSIAPATPTMYQTI